MLGRREVGEIPNSNLKLYIGDCLYIAGNGCCRPHIGDNVCWRRHIWHKVLIACHVLAVDIKIHGGVVNTIAYR